MSRLTQAGIAGLTGDPTKGDTAQIGKTGRITIGRGPYVNLADVLDPVAGDHSAALKTTIDTNGAGYTYHIPDGMDVKLPLTPYATTTPQLLHRQRIRGEGPGSRILVTGYGANPGGTYAALAITGTPGTVEDVALEDLSIEGDGPGASQTWTNRQAAAVMVAPTAGAVTRTAFRRVTFLNHDGFPVHANGIETATIVEFCRFINCGNGCNVNSNFSQIVRNYFTNSEGVECSAIGAVIDANLFVAVFSVGISSGGNQNVQSYPASRITNNLIFGVLGGASYGTGHGILTAESSPDQYIGGNYVERTYANGYNISHSASKGPDDGHTLVANHAVSCGDTTQGSNRNGFFILAPNTRLIGNRAYNRVALSGDTYPTTGYASLFPLIIQSADNVLVDDCMLNAANGGTYAADLNAATNLRWGMNPLTGGTGGILQFRNGATFADASQVATRAVSGANPANPDITIRRMVVVSPGANRTSVLHSAAGLTNKRITFVNTQASFTYTVTPSGTETINGVNASKVLSSAYSILTLESDGANWIIVEQLGTVT